MFQEQIERLGERINYGTTVPSCFVYRSAEIPFDPYWAAAFLASYRAVLSIVGSSMVGKCRRRLMYLTCTALSAFGTFTLAAYCYLNQDGLLTTTFPMARWIPLIAILFVYGAFSFGIGAIPYMLQASRDIVYAVRVFITSFFVDGFSIIFSKHKLNLIVLYYYVLHAMISF